MDESIEINEIPYSVYNITMDHGSWIIKKNWTKSRLQKRLMTLDQFTDTQYLICGSNPVAIIFYT